MISSSSSHILPGAVESELSRAQTSEDRDLGVRFTTVPRRLDEHSSYRDQKSEVAAAGGDAATTEPKPGRLIYIKQMHARPEHGPSKKAQVTRSQQAVLDALLETRPVTVFAEGDLEGSRPSPEVRDQARTIFAGYKPGQRLSKAQQAAFEVLPGYLFYFYLTDGVQLIPPIRDDECAILDAYAEKNSSRIIAEGAITGEDYFHMFLLRELAAIKTIAEWRQKNPGKVSALVFGAAHDFEAREKMLGGNVCVIDASFRNVDGKGAPKS